MRLKKLVDQKLVLKKTKTGEFAGDDRTEYKLTEKGLKELEAHRNHEQEIRNRGRNIIAFVP